MDKCVENPNKPCTYCGNCDICDLDPTKICDSCEKCIFPENDYLTINVEIAEDEDNV